jgi:hypothetical protein
LINLQSTLADHIKILEDHHNHSLTIENFMEKYMPIKVQTQISETCKSFIDKRGKKHLEQHETIKFDELHAAILLDEGDPAIKKQMQALSNKYDAANTPVTDKRHLNSSKTLPCNLSVIN